MGGIVSRYYVQRLWGIDRVQRFTLASPHHGHPWLTYVSPGCVQMRPDSPFLQQQDAIMLEQLNLRPSGHL